jgi:hypothetical protein
MSIAQPNFDAILLGLLRVLASLSTPRELNSKWTMIRQLGQVLRMKGQKCKRSRGRAGLADPFVNILQTFNTSVMANPSTFISRISRCGLAMNNGQTRDSPLQGGRNVVDLIVKTYIDRNTSLINRIKYATTIREISPES